MIEVLPDSNAEHSELDDNQLRAQEVAAQITALAPEMPEVTLRQTSPARRGSTSLDTLVALHNGEEVGSATILTDRLGRNQSFQRVVVPEEKRGQGYGTSIYRAAISKAMEEGHAFKTHEYSQTPGAKRIWENLGRIGVARVIEPFTEPDDEGHSVGMSVVMPATNVQFRHERNRPEWWDEK